MATCKEARKDLKSVEREEKALRAEVRTANAAVVEAVKKLPPLYVDTQQAREQRARVQPLVDRAQAASTKWFDANARLVNKREFVASRCPRKAK